MIWNDLIILACGKQSSYGLQRIPVCNFEYHLICGPFIHGIECGHYCACHRLVYSSATSTSGTVLPKRFKVCSYLSPGGEQSIRYSDVIMSAMASQITSFTIGYSTVYSCADKKTHQSSVSLAFVWGIHQWPVNSPHKWPVARKMLPFDDVACINNINLCWLFIQCIIPILNSVTVQYSSKLLIVLTLLYRPRLYIEPALSWYEGPGLSGDLSIIMTGIYCKLRKRRHKTFVIREIQCTICLESYVVYFYAKLWECLVMEQRNLRYGGRSSTSLWFNIQLPVDSKSNIWEMIQRFFILFVMRENICRKIYGLENRVCLCAHEGVTLVFISQVTK